MMMCVPFHRFLFLWWLYIAFLCPGLCQSDSGLVAGNTTRDYFDAKLRLVEYLTNNSEIMKEILPARDINTPVDVKVKIKLRQITVVDETNQAIRLAVWLRFNWNNPFLAWDPAEYGGIESVHVNHELFWVPDVALFNEATLSDDIPILYKRFATKLIIDKHGDCWWNVPTTLSSQCIISVSSFPFDTQECSTTIGSWTYSRNKINITYSQPNADLSHFIDNGEWLVESALLHNSLKHYEYYGKDELPSADVILTLKIKRLTKYYWINIIAPSTIIWGLTLLSFILPSDNGERVTLVISALVALSVYMLIASSFLPVTSEAVPILGRYYLAVFITTALCLCATCCTLMLRNMTSQWVGKNFVAKIKNLVCCCSCKCKKGTPPVDTESNVESIDLDNKARGHQAKTTEDTDSGKKTGDDQAKTTEDTDSGKRTGDDQTTTTEDTDSGKKAGDDQTTTTGDSDSGNMAKTGQESNPEDIGSKNMAKALLEELRLLIGELRSKNDEEEFPTIWKRAADVLDICFLFVFLVLYVGLFFGFFSGHL